MVLPSSSAPDREGPGDPGWLERITRVLGRTAKGVVVLCDRASPGSLRDLVAHLIRAGHAPEVVAEANELTDLPNGAVVVLAAETRHAGWLNLGRPILHERAVRLILWSPEEVTEELRRSAPDLFDWISHRVECPPPEAAPHAVKGLRGALRARAPGIEWRGADLKATFEAALPGRPLEWRSASLSATEMADGLRRAGRAWFVWSDVDGFGALRRVREAHAAIRRRTRLILFRPVMVVPELWPVHDRFAVLGEACAALRGMGATSPGRLAALTGLEPEAIELLVERLRAGEDSAALERGLVEAPDPGAWLARGTPTRPILSPPQWRAGLRPEPRGLEAYEKGIGHTGLSRALLLPNLSSTAMIGGDAHADDPLFLRSEAQDTTEAYLRRAATEASLSGDHAREAAARLELGRVAARRAAWLDAEDALRRAAEESRSAGDQAQEGAALAELGRVFHITGRVRAAEAMFREALTHMPSENSAVYAAVLRNLGVVYEQTSRSSEAEQAYERAWLLYRALGDARGEAETLVDMGRHNALTSRWIEAEEALDRALPMHRARKDQLGEANTLCGLSALYLQTNRQAKAESSLDLALLLYRVLELPLDEANVLIQLGSLYLRTNRLNAAESVYEQALRMHRAHGWKLGEATTLFMLGEVYRQTDRAGDAERAYNQALAIYRALENRSSEAMVLHSLGNLYMETSRLSDAERTYDQAAPIYRALGDSMGEAGVNIGYGALALRHEKPLEAFQRFHSALRTCEALRSASGVAAALTNLGKVALAAGSNEKAVVLAARALIELHGVDADHSIVVPCTIMVIALVKMDDKQFVDLMLLAWALACQFGDRNASDHASILREMGIDVNEQQLIKAHEKGFSAAQETAIRYEKLLQERGEDVYSLP